MLLEFRCYLSYKHSWRPLTSHYCRCWCRLMSSSLLQFITPLRLHTSYNMITCWVKLTKSISEECVGAEICAAFVGTPTMPPNYTCVLVGAGLMPAMKPGCITWITTNWITNWHCRVTLFIQCEHTKGFWPDYTGIMTWYVGSFVKLIACNPRKIHILQLETLLFFLLCYPLTTPQQTTSFCLVIFFLIKKILSASANILKNK